MTRRSIPLGDYAFDQSADYRILLRGRLDASWSDELAGMTVTAVAEGGGEPATLLTGRLLDQAALYGLLQFTYNLGLTILVVKRVEWQEANERL